MLYLHMEMSCWIFFLVPLIALRWWWKLFIRILANSFHDCHWLTVWYSSNLFVFFFLFLNCWLAIPILPDDEFVAKIIHLLQLLLDLTTLLRESTAINFYKLIQDFIVFFFFNAVVLTCKDDGREVGTRSLFNKLIYVEREGGYIGFTFLTHLFLGLFNH